MKGEDVEPLINRYEEMDADTMEDFLICIMSTIEAALLEAGFRPDQDYTRKDLFCAAMPIVTNKFNSGGLTFVNSWPKGA